MKTLSELRQGVRDWISEPANAGAFTDAMLTRQINSSLRTLAIKILNEYPDFYYDTATITTTAGTYLYEVEDDHFQTLGIKNSSGTYLGVLTIEDVQFADQTSDRAADATGYTRKGNYIWLHPTPLTSSKTYTHEHYIIPADLSDDDDEPNFPIGHEHLIETDVALRCGIIDGAEIGAVKMKWMEDWKDMLSALQTWQTFEPPSINISRGNFGAMWPNTDTVK